MNLLQQKLKTYIKRLFLDIGLELTRKQALNGSPIPFLEIMIQHFNHKDKIKSLLQIGANDGVRFDPVRYSIIKHNLSAVLVEPLPDLFRQLQSNYADQPKIKFENVAVSNFSGEAELFRIKNNMNHLPDWAQGLASFDKQHLLKPHTDWEGFKEHDLEPLIEKVRVPVITIAQILGKYSWLSPLLVLQIDTEGHDFQVIKSAFDAQCFPRIIHYEHTNLSYSDQFSCRDLLTSKGYYFFSDRADTLAIRTPLD